MTNHSPRVSVILTTFNRAALLPRSVESVLRQTLEDLELIIVDDCSTDNTPQVASQFADPRVRVIRHAENQGLADARNNGILAARGEYVCFLDDDDEWLPDKLAAQVRAFVEEESPDSVLIFTQAFLDDGISSNVRPTRGLKADERLCDYLMRGEGLVGPSSIMMTRRLALDHPFTPHQRRFEDYSLYLGLEARGVVFRLLAEPLIIWHIDVGRSRLSRKIEYREAVDWLDSRGASVTRTARRAFLAREVAPFLAAPSAAPRMVTTIALAALCRSISMGEAAKAMLKGFLPPGAIVGMRRRLRRDRFG